VNVLIDTAIWSLAFRRATPRDDPNVLELRRLIDELRAEIIGPIRQEILSGINEQPRFDSLRQGLRAFPDLPIGVDDYECAADYFNVCRRNGIQGSNTDFLICAVAAERNLAIFTTDRDFQRYQAHIPIVLHVARESD
jgi:predicted nucleic acid-binding protein